MPGGKRPGPIILIGGHEQKQGERVILRRVAAATAGLPLVVATIASDVPDKYIARYREAFAGLPIGELVHLPVGGGGGPMERAGGVFLTGGKQQRLVRHLGTTARGRAIRQLWERGGVVAGTSAGASALGGSMLVGKRVMPGLGYVPGVLIDQHFSQRDRLGRLQEVVEAHPDLVGIGIDEDTALILTGPRREVVGSGTVTFVDQSGVRVFGSGVLPVIEAGSHPKM